MSVTNPSLDPPSNLPDKKMTHREANQKLVELMAEEMNTNQKAHPIKDELESVSSIKSIPDYKLDTSNPPAQKLHKSFRAAKGQA